MKEGIGMIMELGCFENEVLHCIENNPKNDNFKFDVRARNNSECLEILNNVKENKENFEKELSKIIGDCIVLIDFENIMVTVKRKQL